VLPIEEARVPRSLIKVLRKTSFRISMDTAFAEVMTACGQQARPGQRGTWITKPMIDGYTQLHDMGLAHSVEVWRGDELVGGLYGVSFGAVFFGESMFARADDASKMGFATMVAQLSKWSFYVVDCQQETVHLARFGASLWPRQRFLDALDEHVVKATLVGPWQLSMTAADASAWWLSRPSDSLP
jgi:leucyl/phenylalanyl-tRNA---protein transferase